LYLGGGVVVIGLIGAIFTYVRNSKEESDERTVSVKNDQD
jgi:hypothetical protein